MEPVSLVQAEDLAAVPVDNLAGLRAKIFPYEFIVVYLSQKTDALAVFTGRARQSFACGDFPYAGLGQIPYREHYLAQLRITYLRQEIGLVLVLVECGRKMVFSVKKQVTRIMPGSYLVETASVLVDKRSELYQFVAHHVRIRRKPLFDGLQCICHHGIPILLLQGNRFKLQTVFFANEARYLDILFGRTAHIAALVFHADANIKNSGFLPLLAKQMGYHRTVHTS